MTDQRSTHKSSRTSHAVIMLRHTFRDARASSCRRSCARGRISVAGRGGGDTRGVGCESVEVEFRAGRTSLSAWVPGASNFAETQPPSGSAGGAAHAAMKAEVSSPLAAAVCALLLALIGIVCARVPDQGSWSRPARQQGQHSFFGTWLYALSAMAAAWRHSCNGRRVWARRLPPRTAHSHPPSLAPRSRTRRPVAQNHCTHL